MSYPKKTMMKRVHVAVDVAVDAAALYALDWKDVHDWWGVL